MTESFFPISNNFMLEKNIENTQFLIPSIHTFQITNLEKSLSHSDLPIDKNKIITSLSQPTGVVLFTNPRSEYDPPENNGPPSLNLRARGLSAGCSP